MQASIAVDASIWQRLMVPLLLNRLALSAIIRLARKTLAFNLEAFLKYHFTKVGDQNREMMASYIALAEKRATKSDAFVDIVENKIHRTSSVKVT